MPKSTLISIFSLSLLALTMPLALAIDSNLEQPTFHSQLQTVSSDLYSHPEYTFIASLILRTYPELQNASLDEVKQKQDESIGQILYLFIYDNSSNSSEPNGTTKQVTVLSHQYGTLYSILEDSRALDTYYRQHQEPMIVGGNDTVDTQSLDQIEQEAKQFLTNNLPYLQKWQLISVRTQVVAGKYICFAFQNTQTSTKEQYCVLSQPWLNGYLQFTTSDGTIYTKGGFGCNPQTQAQSNTQPANIQNQGSNIANESNFNPMIPDSQYPSTTAPSPSNDSPIPSFSSQNASNTQIPQSSQTPSPILDIVPAPSTDNNPSPSGDGSTSGGSISLLPPINTLPSPTQPVPSSNQTIFLPPSNPNGLRRLLLTQN